MRRKIINNRFGNTKAMVSLDLKGIKTYVLGGLCGLMVMASIFITIESSANRVEYAGLLNKKAQLLTEQESLQQTLVQTLSINTLQEQSSALGFARVGNLVYVAGPGSAEGLDPVAKLQ